VTLRFLLEGGQHAEEDSTVLLSRGANAPAAQSDRHLFEVQALQRLQPVWGFRFSGDLQVIFG